MSLEQYERVLEVADERARRYLAGVDDRPVAEQASVGELRKSLDRKLPDGGRGSGEGGRGARGRRRARPDRARQPALLRVRDRRDAAGRAGSGLAGRGLGSDREPLCLRPLGRGRRGGLRALGARGARPADGRRLRPHHRGHDGELLGDRRRAARGSRAGGLGRRGEGPERRAGGAGARRRARPRDDLRGAAAAGPRLRERDPREGGRRRPHGSGGAGRGARPRARDRRSSARRPAR